MIAARFVILLITGGALAEGAALAGDEPPPPPPGALLALRRHATDLHNTIAEQLNTIVHSENTKDLSKAVREGSDSVLHQLTELTKSLQTALTDANNKMKEALEQTRQNLEKTVEGLRAAHPDVERHALALRDRLHAAVRATAQETQKLAKEVAANMEQTNQKLAPKIKAAYDDFVKQTEAERVQNKSEGAAVEQ